MSSIRKWLFLFVVFSLIGTTSCHRKEKGELCLESALERYSMTKYRNISLRLVTHFGDARSIGLIFRGLAKPIHVLPNDTEVNNIVNLAAIASVDAP